jgi:hypothetical protein
MFRCPRAPFSISLSHYFSFKSKRSFLTAQNTKEKIHFRIVDSMAAPLGHHEHSQSIHGMRTALTSASADVPTKPMRDHSSDA